MDNQMTVLFFVILIMGFFILRHFSESKNKHVKIKRNEFHAREEERHSRKNKQYMSTISNKSMPLIYKQLGGLRIGKSEWVSLNISWPLVKIEIYSEKIIISYLIFNKIELPKNKINYIEKYKIGILGGFHGLRIDHNVKSISPFIFLGGFSNAKLISNIKSAGYKIEESNKDAESEEEYDIFNEKNIICPNCKQNVPHREFCIDCGTELKENKTIKNLYNSNF